MDPMTDVILGTIAEVTAPLHLKIAEQERDIETLRRLFIAGRDMNDSVTRFLERLDAKAPSYVTEMWINQMRIDHQKWMKALAP